VAILTIGCQTIPAIMNISEAVSGYLTKMVSVGDSSSGSQTAKMKILLLDKDTVGLSASPISRKSGALITAGSNCINRHYAIRPIEP
jgi:hypothetical protein